MGFYHKGFMSFFSLQCFVVFSIQLQCPLEVVTFTALCTLQCNRTQKAPVSTKSMWKCEINEQSSNLIGNLLQASKNDCFVICYNLCFGWNRKNTGKQQKLKLRAHKAPFTCSTVTIIIISPPFSAQQKTLPARYFAISK